jgi:hypothetical protein
MAKKTNIFKICFALIVIIVILYFFFKKNKTLELFFDGKHDIHTLTYSIPIEKIQTNLKKKTIEMAYIDPRNRKTYIYDNEKDYYNGYNISKYAITMKKGGWDCLRHYEIIACGCLPIFLDIDKCPINTLDTELKKQLLYINKNYKNFNDNDYETTRNKLYNYLKENLTCKAVAEKFLKLNNNPKSVLMLQCNKYINYSRELLSIGLRKILKTNFVDYPKNYPLYKNQNKDRKLYGKGFTYSNIFDEDNIDRSNIKKRIKNNEFDLIIYGKMGSNEGMFGDVRKLAPYWNTVKKTKNICFIYGGDINNKEHIRYHSKFGKCFVRERDSRSKFKKYKKNKISINKNRTKNQNRTRNKK